MQMLGSRSGGSANFDSSPPAKTETVAKDTGETAVPNDDFDDDIPF